MRDEKPAGPAYRAGPSREQDIIAAAALKSARKLSYADSFAAALARKENAALTTGDPELRELNDALTVEWIGADP